MAFTRLFAEYFSSFIHERKKYNSAILQSVKILDIFSKTYNRHSVHLSNVSFLSLDNFIKEPAF